MAKKRKTARRVTAVANVPPVARPVHKPWTLLFYICGDNDILDASVGVTFADICSVGSSPQFHLVVQCDRRLGAQRYVLPEGPSENPPCDTKFATTRVNTGDPREAINFLQWGIEQAPSDRIAVIFSGLGINPAYVAELLIPQEARTGTLTATNDRIQERLFSICHDQTSFDALEAHELSEIFDPIVKQLGRPIDLFGLDLGVAAFAEIGYQLQGLADLLVASQRPLPDAGWPYQAILQSFSASLADGDVEPQDLARLLVDCVADRFPEKEYDVRMAAIDLTNIESVARALDTVSLAIMQNLGNVHVLDAIRSAGKKTAWISPCMSSEIAETPKDLPAQANFLPAVDLLELLTNTQQALKRAAAATPEDQADRPSLVQLAALLDSALKVMKPKRRGESRLLLHSRPIADRGLSILLPPQRAQNKEGASHKYRLDLSNSIYLKLRFSSRVHWSAMMGAFQLITEKPHVLWRLISSVLANASGPARDALMQQLVSGNSVIGDLQEQFRSLSNDAALTLSLEPKSFGEAGAVREYLLRLESPVSAATVAEQVSRLYQTTIDAALNGLEQLLRDPGGATNIAGQLESLGRTLGEDLIQDLSSRLAEEREALAKTTTDTPHLRLQIPVNLMRYPWELMHDRYGMLCERFAFGRQVFMASDFARRRSPRKSGAIRVLVIGDPEFDPEFLNRLANEQGNSPPQLPGARAEAKSIVTAFQQLAAELAEMPSVTVKSLIGKRLSLFEMREFLRSGQFDIIHFAGHAQFVAEDPEGSAWLLSDGLLRARDIRNTLAWTESPPWLVFANACESGMDAATSIGRYQGDVYGLATACINQGVAAYIAPLWPVDDRMATELAVSFYYSLLANRLSLGESLFRAKGAVREKVRQRDGDSPETVAIPREVLSWASFVLYGDPTRQLLESLWSPHAGTSTKRPDAKPVTPTVAADASTQRMRGFTQSVVVASTTNDDPRV